MNLVETLFFEEFESTKIDTSALKHQFKLPIQYSKNCKTIDENVQQDLETDKVYRILYGETKYNSLIDNLSKHYTTETKFLEQHQKFIKKISDNQNDINSSSLISLREKWTELMEHPNVKEQYFYLEWKHLDCFNYHSTILLLLSLTHIGSPIISLVAPIVIFLLVPILFLRFMYKTSLSSEQFYNFVFKSPMNPLSRYFSLFSSKVPFNEKMKTMAMLSFYLLSFYQNILLCIKFYKNMFEIKSYLFETKQMLLHSQKQMKNISKMCSEYNEFIPFCKTINEKQTDIELLLKNPRFDIIQNDKFTPLQLLNIGKMMSLFYTLRNEVNIQKLYVYCFELNEYIYHMKHLKTHFDNKQMAMCRYTTEKENTQLRDSYHPVFVDNTSTIKNNVSLKKNIIITGPNASGKTTLLKSTLYNILLSQQIGAGCYNESSRVFVYDKFFSYLNIPDTTERDSLFESEARRCLTFLNEIKNTSKDNITDDSVINENSVTNHFLIFDEMYSGTNPSEASVSGLSFINYLSKQNVSFMITTHYYDMCNSKLLSNNIVNQCMYTETTTEGNLHYTYQLKKGVSYVKGGIEVLKRLNYPTEIINSIHQIEKYTIDKNENENETDNIKNYKKNTTINELKSSVKKRKRVLQELPQ